MGRACAGDAELVVAALKVLTLDDLLAGVSFARTCAFLRTEVSSLLRRKSGDADGEVAAAASNGFFATLIAVGSLLVLLAADLRLLGDSKVVPTLLQRGADGSEAAATVLGASDRRDASEVSRVDL